MAACFGAAMKRTPEGSLREELELSGYLLELGASYRPGANNEVRLGAFRSV